MIYLAYYLIGAGIALPLIFLANLWLEQGQRWSQKTKLWMVGLWPATAVLLAVVFFFFGICRLAGFITEKPKSNWGRRIKETIARAGDAVMEPIVNRIVK